MPFGGFGGGIFLAEVRIQEGEPLENALRRFKRKSTAGGHHQGSQASLLLPESPVKRKRVKAALARKRNRKKARKEARLVSNRIVTHPRPDSPAR